MTVDGRDPARFDHPTQEPGVNRRDPWRRACWAWWTPPAGDVRGQARIGWILFR
jgi:hypothetical protein